MRLGHLALDHDLFRSLGRGHRGPLLGSRGGDRIRCASSPCTPSRRINHGRVSPCRSSVPITTTNVRNTMCGRPGNGAPDIVVKGTARRQRGDNPAHARPRDDDDLGLRPEQFP